MSSGREKAGRAVSFRGEEGQRRRDRGRREKKTEEERGGRKMKQKHVAWNNPKKQVIS